MIYQLSTVKTIKNAFMKDPDFVVYHEVDPDFEQFAVAAGNKVDREKVRLTVENALFCPIFLESREKSKIVFTVVPYINRPEEIKATLWKDIRGQERIWDTGIPLAATQEYWGHFAEKERVTCISSLLKKCLKEIEPLSKVALDLGCGSGATARVLLERGWKVIAVDNSQKSLQLLQERALASNPKCLETGQLQLVHQKVEEYTFPYQVDMVIADRILMYIKPSAMPSVWNKIHAALIEGGMFMMTVFSYSDVRAGESNEEYQNLRRNTKYWVLHDPKYMKNLVETTYINTASQNDTDELWSFVSVQTYLCLKTDKALGDVRLGELPITSPLAKT